MNTRIQTITAAIAMTACIALAADANAQTSSSFSRSFSSSSGSSFGTRTDGTTFQNGFTNSSSRQNATTTTRSGGPFSNQSRTTSLSQSQSRNSGFAQSSGPGGFQRRGFNNQSGSLSLTDTRRQNGLLTSATDTRSINANFQRGNSFSQGFGPGGVFDNRSQTSSGNVTVGRRVNANSIFGPSVQAGQTRTVGFINQRTSSRGINSGGIFNNNTNSSNVNISGNDFFHFQP